MINLLKLTTPNGENVWINPEAIESIVKAYVIETESVAKIAGIRNARIEFGGDSMQIVQETPEQIIKLINQ